MDLKQIVERIRYFRYEKNLSGKDLSLLIDKEQSYINKLESYDFTPSLKVLFKIIDALEITPEEFFAENYLTFKNDRDLLEKIKKLKKDKRETLLKFLD